MIKVMIQIRLEPSALKRIMSIWPDSEGRPGITAYVMSKSIPVSEQTILNYISANPETFNPKWNTVKDIERFFGGLIMFCVDSASCIDNEKNIRIIEDFLQNHFYKKSSKH